ncbi:MAG TPA: FAD:protein FMN transferase [Devosia sp.]
MAVTRLIMGMPITVEIGGTADDPLVASVFDYFDRVDRRFSTYKPDSEVEALNRGDIDAADLSEEMREVLDLARLTRAETGGYFDINRGDGTIDPSGIVKGWAIRNAARMVSEAGHADFFIDAGGDIQSAGVNASGKPWRVGIRNPFDEKQIVKVLVPRGRGVATSGSYVRGHHIYDPHDRGSTLTDIVSLTVVGSDVLEADRFATAAFAMGRRGIHFIEQRPGLEGYAIDSDGTATMTSGFGAFCP